LRSVPQYVINAYISAAVTDFIKSMSTPEKSRISLCMPRVRFIYSNSIKLSMRYSSAVSGERPLTTVR